MEQSRQNSWNLRHNFEYLNMDILCMVNEKSRISVSIRRTLWLSINFPPKTNRSSEESNAEPRREMPPVLSRSFFGLRPAPPPAQSAKQKRGKFPPRRL